MKVNKFNIHWQIVRARAKDIKDVSTKIHYVMVFLKNNANIYNYERVMNWLVMTALAYGDDKKVLFAAEVKYLKDYKSNYSSDVDSDNDLSVVSDADLMKVYNDLKKRKYGFQFKTVPKDHVAFMNDLESEIEKRKSR